MPHVFSADGTKREMNFENIFHSNLIQVEIQERCTPQ